MYRFSFKWYNVKLVNPTNAAPESTAIGKLSGIFNIASFHDSANSFLPSKAASLLYKSTTVITNMKRLSTSKVLTNK